MRRSEEDMEELETEWYGGFTAGIIVGAFLIVALRFLWLIFIRS